MEQMNSSVDNCQFLVSFCIPTYNRAEVLEICIQSIVNQKSFTDSVEIVISDNASTDSTKKIVEKYKLKYPNNIIYHRNEVNIGMEENFISALDLGNGKLLRLINDYSIIADNYLDKLTNYILQNKEEESVLFFMNETKEQESIKFFCLDDFLKKVTFWTTWIGTFSIWQSDYQEIDNKKKYLGLLFFHNMLLFDVFRSKRKVTIYYDNFLSISPFVKNSDYNFINIFVGNYIGEILYNLRKNKEINISTYWYVKTVFCYKFLFPQLREVILKTTKNKNFDLKGLNIVFFNFYLNPILYISTFKLFIEILIFKIKRTKQIR
jgi:glycosyltransferase involved in cell wall biosynthesis